MSDPTNADDLVVMKKETYEMLKKVVYDAHLDNARLQQEIERLRAPVVETRRRAKSKTVLEQCPYCGGAPARLEPHPTRAGVQRQIFACGHKRNVWP
jgi:hypothetical protein